MAIHNLGVGSEMIGGGFGRCFGRQRTSGLVKAADETSER
jgi:hypothetical protein